jgi:Flp pilus assembly protein protease CpaA
VAIALFGFCLLTALFLNLGADQAIHFRKNIAMAGGFLTLAILGPGAWSLTVGAGARFRARPSYRPSRRFVLRRPAGAAYREAPHCASAAPAVS